MSGRARLPIGGALSLVALWPAMLLAQSVPPQPGIIDRVAPAAPPSLGPALLPPAPTATTGPGATQRVRLGTVEISGATALPVGRLHPLVEGLANRLASLAEIETARVALLGAYRAAGFPYVAVSAALEREAEDRAALRFAVTEGTIAAITVEGASLGPAEAQLRRFLTPLLDQRPLPHAALERALLLAGDVAGMEVQGLLRPMDAPGAMALLVRATRRPVTGFASLDNRGNSTTGAWQGLLVTQFNAFTSLGERTEIAALRTDGNGQNFVQVTEEVFLGGSGLRLRAFAGGGRAVPGLALSPLGYLGDTRVAGLAVSQPLIRSRPRNLVLTAQLDAFESTVELRRFRASRDAVRAARLALEWEERDALLPFAPAAAISTLALRGHRGLETLGASDGTNGTTARLGSDFGFFRATLDATRTQPLLTPAEGWLLSLHAAGSAQWSDDLLPPAEKFYLGGNRLGRGFYAGQIAGDRAAQGGAELQLSTEFTLQPGRDAFRLGTQFYLFRDEGRATDNDPGSEARRIASWGGGVRLQWDERWQIDLEAAHRITRTPEGQGVRALDSDAIFARLLLRY